jgi:hypothetical protein
MQGCGSALRRWRGKAAVFAKCPHGALPEKSSGVLRCRLQGCQLKDDFRVTGRFRQIASLTHKRLSLLRREFGRTGRLCVWFCWTLAKVFQD